ncbi:MAG: hypothetical protein U0570_02130 [Phycisphaerales bacterium]
MRPISQRVFISSIVIGLCAGGLSACSSSGSAGLFTITGTTSLATGDWDDVNAAVLAAAQHREMAVVSQSQPDAKTLEYHLITVNSEPVTVIVTRDSLPNPDMRLSQEGPIALRIAVTVGRFGDSTKEREFIDDMRTRLGDLVGPFTTKPLPKSWGGWGN